MPQLYACGMARSLYEAHDSGALFLAGTEREVVDATALCLETDTALKRDMAHAG